MVQGKHGWSATPSAAGLRVNSRQLSRTLISATSDRIAKPDLVFRRRRCVIFIHGCFWHQHPDPACKIARLPKSRQDFWASKFTRNRERDTTQAKALENMGWRVLTIWECQLKENSELKENIRRFLEAG